MIRATAVIAVLLSLLAAGTADAASLQRIGVFQQPIYLTSDPGNPGRLFVVERAGRIEQLQNGAVSTFADLRSLVGTEVEDGLLSIALAPDFDSSGRLFVDYTGAGEGEIHVAEMRATGGGAPFGSLRNLLTIPHPGHKNHNGGQLQFGPEGMLFISTGDGGGNNDVENNAQTLDNLLGKMLRISPDPSGVLPYTVPAGNPFPLAPSPDDTIWSYGLRNPFRFSFDRLNGNMLIGDVGEGKREEVDLAPAPSLGAAANYGWNCREGTIVGPATDTGCAGSKASDFVEPIFDYPHEDPGGGAAHGCAIIGGYAVRDASLGSLYGRYLYGDLCTGEIRSLSLTGPAVDRSEGLTVPELNSFGEDSCGRLYAISGSGVVSRFVGPTAASCPEVSGGGRTASYVGIRAQSRRVERNRRVLITAFVSPCTGRKGEPVKLLRGGRHVATRRLDRACTAHFRPRISRGAGFRATIGEDANSLAGFSRKLRIHIKHHRRARR